MALRVAINGFGRIGRMVLRAASKDDALSQISDKLKQLHAAEVVEVDRIGWGNPGELEVEGPDKSTRPATSAEIAERFALDSVIIGPFFVWRPARWWQFWKWAALNRADG